MTAREFKKWFGQERVERVHGIINARVGESASLEDKLQAAVSIILQMEDTDEGRQIVCDTIRGIDREFSFRQVMEFAEGNRTCAESMKAALQNPPDWDAAIKHVESVLNPANEVHEKPDL